MQEVTRVREEVGWTQQRLADESGVNKATINQIERGRRSPNVETLEKLADAMGREMGDFFPKAQASLPLEKPAEASSAERRVLKVLAGYKDLAEGLADQVEALLTDVAERSEEPPGESVGGSVGTLLRSYCRLDDVIRPQLPEFLTDLSLPQAEYELAQETWEELDRIGAMFERVHAKLAAKEEVAAAGAQVIDLEEIQRRRAEHRAASERGTRRASG